MSTPGNGPELLTVVEVMGHRTEIGAAEETTVAGVPMLKITTPLGAEYLFAGAALFSIEMMPAHKACRRWPHRFTIEQRRQLIPDVYPSELTAAACDCEGDEWCNVCSDELAKAGEGTWGGDPDDR
jgi:hypothetical protein